MTPPKPKKYLLSSEPMTIFQSIIAFDPTQLVLEVTPDIKERVWLQISNSTSPTNRWQKYLNQVTLDTFLPWLQEEEATAKVRLDRATQTDRREVVNGTLIDLDSAKLVLIPSEAIDLSDEKLITDINVLWIASKRATCGEISIARSPRCAVDSEKDLIAL